MDQSDYFSVFEACVGLRGRSVLEVGGSIAPSTIEAAKPKSWTAINISQRYSSGEVLPRWYEEKIMSVTRMDFPSNSFDAVFSSNCFEHVDDIPKAFSEIYRVLKPGGVFFTIFGPIWSGPVGHHTWVWDNGKPLTFNDNVFPAWAHLNKTRSEMGDLLKWRYQPETIESVLKYVYDSKDINRNPDSVFEKEIWRHRFIPIIKYRIKTKDFLSRHLRSELKWKHPKVTDFRTTGFFWVLAKDRTTPFRYFHAYIGAARELVLKKLFGRFWLPVPKPVQQQVQP